MCDNCCLECHPNLDNVLMLEEATRRERHEAAAAVELAKKSTPVPEPAPVSETPEKTSEIRAVKAMMNTVTAAITPKLKLQQQQQQPVFISVDGYRWFRATDKDEVDRQIDCVFKALRKQYPYYMAGSLKADMDTTIEEALPLLEVKEYFLEQGIELRPSFFTPPGRSVACLNYNFRFICK